MRKATKNVYGFIDLSLDRTDFVAGNNVTGAVYLGISSPYPGNKLEIKIVGRERYALKQMPDKSNPGSYKIMDEKDDNIKICANDTDKIIFKSMDEHTSSISNIYKVDTEYLIVTENTIYIISAKTKVAKMPEELSYN